MRGQSASLSDQAAKIELYKSRSASAASKRGVPSRDKIIGAIEEMTEDEEESSRCQSNADGLRKSRVEEAIDP